MKQLSISALLLILAISVISCKDTGTQSNSQPTSRRPGLGSYFTYDQQSFDRFGAPDSFSIGDSMWMVLDTDIVTKGKHSTVFYQVKDTLGVRGYYRKYLAYEPDGTVSIYSSEDLERWNKFPTRSYEVIIDTTVTEGPRTEHLAFTASYKGDISQVIGGISITSHVGEFRISDKTTEPGKPDDSGITTLTYHFAPSLGYFTYIENFEDFPGTQQRQFRHRIQKLKSYVLK